MVECGIHHDSAEKIMHLKRKIAGEIAKNHFDK